MMTRPISVIRRRPNLVDLIVPFVYGVDGYRIKAANAFDAVAATVLTSSNVGFRDPNVDPNKIDVQGVKGVRIVFDPASYMLDDTIQHWLWFYTVTGGIETVQSAPLLLLPDQSLYLSRGLGHIVIKGVAPNAADMSGSLQLDLPRTMSDWRVHNEDSTHAAYIAFEPGGPEVQIPAGGTLPQISTYTGASASCWIRGSGGSPTLTITATVSVPR
jgi:hypothetical protein